MTPSVDLLALVETCFKYFKPFVVDSLWELFKQRLPADERFLHPDSRDDLWMELSEKVTPTIEASVKSRIFALCQVNLFYNPNISKQELEDCVLLSATDLRQQVRAQMKDPPSSSSEQRGITSLKTLYDPSSLYHLRLKPGMQVLEVCDDLTLSCEEIRRCVGESGNIITNAPLALHEDEQKYDRIHCRFVLSYYPLEQAIQILNELLAHIAPGGFLLLEEITSLDSLSCQPEYEGYKRFKELVHKIFYINRLDSCPGQKLLQYLRGQGYEVEVFFNQPLLKTVEEKSAIFESVKNAQHLLFLGDLIDSLEHFAKGPYVAKAFEVTQIIVRT